MLLQEALHRPGAVDGVVRRGRHVVDGLRADLEAEEALLQALAEVTELEVHDLLDLLWSERREEHDLVDAVEELRAESLPEELHHLAAHAFGDFAVRGHALREEGRADVGRHDHHGVLEVHRVALTVRQTAVVEELEERVEDVGVGLLDLVEEDHRKGLPPHGLGQLAALLVADVARGRADEAGHRVLLHVLAHVDAHHVVLAVEERGREGAGELGLSDPGGPEEDERADRTLWVLEAGAGAEHGVGDGLDRLALADDTLVEDVGEPQELLALRFEEPGHGDARPVGHDLRHLLGVDLLLDESPGAVPCRETLFLLLEPLLEARELAVLELGGAVEIVFPLGLLDGESRGVDLLAQVPEALDLRLLRLPLGAERVDPSL